MRLAAAEQSIGGVAGALLISACSDMHTLPVPSVLCAANLPDLHWRYIQVFVRSSLTAFRWPYPTVAREGQPLAQGSPVVSSIASKRAAPSGFRCAYGRLG